MKAILMALVVVVLAGCHDNAPSSSVSASSGASANSEMDKQFGGNMNTGRVVDSGAASGACDAACQSRIKQ
jgi:ABC-type Fe3+-hydroxamate transport system substrate-binding protein